MIFLSRDVVLEFSGSSSIHILYICRESEERRESKSNKERKVTDSVLFCVGLL